MRATRRWRLLCDRDVRAHRHVARVRAIYRYIGITAAILPRGPFRLPHRLAQFLSVSVNQRSRLPRAVVTPASDVALHGKRCATGESSFSNGADEWWAPRTVSLDKRGRAMSETTLRKIARAQSERLFHVAHHRAQKRATRGEARSTSYEIDSPIAERGNA
jgi:hypothetical protein